MAVTMTHVPEAASDDSHDVVEALDIARSLWEKGERRDAVRWVRRAVEAADEAGHTTRVVALARAAAELEDVPFSPTSQTRPASRPTAALGKPPKVPPPLPSPKTVAPPPNEKRVRVSVKTSVRDASLLVVRVLPQGQPLPPGTREAFLVMTEDVAQGNVA
jgi:hypothetical protein